MTYNKGIEIFSSRRNVDTSRYGVFVLPDLTMALKVINVLTHSFEHVVFTKLKYVVCHFTHDLKNEKLKDDVCPEYVV